MKNKLMEILLFKAAVIAFLCGISLSASAVGQLSIISESAIYNPITKTVVFRIKFNQVPDFTTRDEFGEPVNAFQYFVNGDSGLPYPQHWDAIIRGSEMSKLDIPIRNAFPPSDDPKAQGWGTIRGVAPYKLEGRVLTFSTQLKSITDHFAHQHFFYDILLTHFGSGTQTIDKSKSSIGPQPSVRSQCLDNYWMNFGFTSQAHCIKYIEGR